MGLPRFALGERVLLIKGARRGAIYNLQDGIIYSIDEKACALLDACENGVGLEQFFAGHLEIDCRESLSYLTTLEERGLGHFIQHNEVPQKTHLAPTKKLLDFLWLEVTSGCNLKCIHCYAGSSPTLIGKDRMSQKDLIAVMQQAAAIGCRKIQFIGGEPFILGNRLAELIETAHELEFGFIEVFTNTTLLSDAMLQILRQYGVHVAASFYSENAHVHESITLDKNSHARAVRNIQRIIAVGLNLRVAVIGMSHNQDTLEATKMYLRKLGVQNVKIDYIRPSGRGCNSNLVPSKHIEKIYMRGATFPKCTENAFKQKLFGHNCFSKAVCIAASGDVFPCIMERDISYGNVLEEPLETILNKALTKTIRGLSKDHVEVCRDCEYRYACFDCRPKAKNMDQDANFFAKPKECLYDPHTGMWQSQKP